MTHQQMSRCYRNRTSDVRQKDKGRYTKQKVLSSSVCVTNVRAWLRDACTHCHGHLRYVDVSVLETGYGETKHGSDLIFPIEMANY